MAIRVVEFSNGGTKLERFLPKNQHTQRKLLNFENWVNGEVSKIRRHFRNKSCSILILSKNVNSPVHLNLYLGSLHLIKHL